MTLLEKNKEALLAMALADQPVADQTRLQQLIQSDPACRAYWEEINSITRDLDNHATRTEPDLPPGFHDRLMNQLTAPNPAARSRQRYPIPTLARSLFVALGLLIIGLFVKHQTAPSPAPQIATEPSLSPLPAATPPDQISWAVLRATTSDPVDLIAASSIPSKPQEHPKMSWREREHWIQEFDL